MKCLLYNSTVKKQIEHSFFVFCAAINYTQIKTRMIKEKVDVLVIGAGPAGCVAAAILNKKGSNI